MKGILYSIESKDSFQLIILIIINKRAKTLIKILIYNFGLVYYLIISRGGEFLLRTYKF